ncbi:hypothetical protein CCACVL1_08252 [Corchorus capsularis]|uniref:Uncharacterized protein n=1 Tax=Corchorus capsularis TaxID=210143 RepID=A0A1R3J1J1_COCAP|nr:hypothetical protein CCACVL1_08252 [Corchorus capsularis]
MRADKNFEGEAGADLKALLKCQCPTCLKKMRDTFFNYEGVFILNKQMLIVQKSKDLALKEDLKKNLEIIVDPEPNVVRYFFALKVSAWAFEALKALASIEVFEQWNGVDLLVNVSALIPDLTLPPSI